ncbi:MAG: stage II sporulation protein M [Chloroflexales bacterium]|nr:stage II sporulation protein M [Chloroflexales bacterium]
MLAEDFIAIKRSSWEELTRLLNRASNGLAGLSADELQTLGRLYRQTTSDLAVARRDFPNHPVNDYLNGLVGRGHSEVYRDKSARARQFIAFFTTTFPQVFRATWGYTLAAFLMFFIPALVCFVIAYRTPDAVAAFLPNFEDVLSDIKSEREWWKQINDSGRTASASFIMTNNIRVAFLAFAGGVLLGTLSLFVLAQNGILLGSIAGAAQQFDFADNLWGFVAAHGVIELSVIFIAGGAGLQLGWSILRPGLYTRRAALVIATNRAFQLLLGCVPLLVIAGTIEGFISPSELPLAVKLTVSLASGILLYSYLLLVGREQRTENNRR